MSLYIFGGIVPKVNHKTSFKPHLRELCDRLNIFVTFDSLDTDDQVQIYDAMKRFGSLNCEFQIFTSQTDADATQLWEESRNFAISLLKEKSIDALSISWSTLSEMELPAEYYERILETRLGGLINGLKLLSPDAVVGVALVDGGIEEVKTGTADQCVKELLKSLVFPWDYSANTFYVLF
jgi:hypothetical protein